MHDSDSAFAADAHQPKLGAALIPVGDLFDAGEFKLVRQGDLVAGRAGAGENIATDVGDSAKLTGDCSDPMPLSVIRLTTSIKLSRRCNTRSITSRSAQSSRPQLSQTPLRYSGSTGCEPCELSYAMFR